MRLSKVLNMLLISETGSSADRQPFVRITNSGGNKCLCGNAIWQYYMNDIVLDTIAPFMIRKDDEYYRTYWIYVDDDDFDLLSDMEEAMSNE